MFISTFDKSEKFSRNSDLRSQILIPGAITLAIYVCAIATLSYAYNANSSSQWIYGLMALILTVMFFFSVCLLCVRLGQLSQVKYGQGGVSQKILHDYNVLVSALKAQTASLKHDFESRQHDDARLHLYNIECLLSSMSAAGQTLRSAEHHHVDTRDHRTDVQVEQLKYQLQSLTSAFPAARDVKVNFDFPLELHRVVNINQRAFLLIFLNLFRNATEHTQQGQIDISVLFSPSKEELQLTISDTGIGISANRLNELNAGNSVESSFGQGVGTSNTYRYVSSEGGQIHYRSMMGQGTEVSVCLPLHSIDQAEKVSPGASSPLKVLLVEDEQICAQSLMALIDDNGFAVDHVSDQAELEQKLEAGQYDLVITDYNLYQDDGSCFTGVDVAKRVGQVSKTPIILWSGSCVEPEEVLSEQHLFYSVIEKCEYNKMIQIMTQLSRQ